MKKYFYFLSILLLLMSCTEDVRFNNPAFQTLKDNNFWRAQVYEAGTASDGTFIIHGALGYDEINFKLPEPTVKTYVLGVDDVTKAIYKNTYKEQKAEFSTGTGKGTGQIIVTEYNKEENTISGTFKFTVINADPSAGKHEMSFSEGVFYKIPVATEGNFVPFD